MDQLLTGLLNDLGKISSTTIEIHAPGEYPVKRRTPVVNVHGYQNDGTERIKPSRYLQRAEKANDWDAKISKELDKDNPDFKKLADDIAQDITNMCDRIDTGRLKASFKGEVKNGI